MIDDDFRVILLGGRVFKVPTTLPLRVNKRAYPMCRTLSNDGLMQKIIKAEGALDCTEAEMEQLAVLTFMVAKVAEPDLTQEQFDDLPVTPPELTDAFFAIRYLTGGWAVTAFNPEGDNGAGEHQGAETPQTSTSTELSPV